MIPQNDLGAIRDLPLSVSIGANRSPRFSLITMITSATLVRIPAFLLFAALVGSGLSGCQATLDATPDSAGADAESGSAGTPVKGPTGSALTALKTIKVKGRAPTTGYSRDEFGPAWADTDNNGCDQRNDILRRDLTGETLKAKTHGCIVLSGTLKDHYTGKTIAFKKASASAVQIDHMVALQNAWTSGANKWTKTKREALATDPLNLMAVDGPTNSAKGAGDAATWLPPVKSYRCAYVARQVAVKVKYEAWMTSGEHDAIEKILKTCPDQELPQVKTIPLGEGSKSETKANDKKTADKDDAKSSGDTVSAGAFCSPDGAKGKTEAGTAMVCSSKDGAPSRWRSAKK